MDKRSHVRICSVLLVALLPIVVLEVRQANANTPGLALHAPILIDGPSAFTTTNGVTGGDGSQNHPYMIQGWRIDASHMPGIEIRNIISEDPVYFVIRNVFIHSDSNTGADIVIDSFASFPTCFECPANVFPGTITNSTLAGNEFGVFLNQSNNIVVSGITVHDAHTSIELQNEAFSLIRNNILTDANVGIDLSSSVDDVLHNTILNSDTGILAAGATLDIEYNNIASPQGILVLGSFSVFIANNQIQGERGPSISLYQYGISENQSDSVSIENNSIANSLPSSVQLTSAGITVNGSGDFAIIGNTIKAGNSYGIILRNTFETFDSSDPFLNHNFVYHNNMLNNTVQAFDNTPGVDLWDNGYPSGGNFWSDYPGVDNCSGPQQNVCSSPDGIGDTPYVFNFNQDPYPLMKQFAG